MDETNHPSRTNLNSKIQNPVQKLNIPLISNDFERIRRKVEGQD